MKTLIKILIGVLFISLISNCGSFDATIRQCATIDLGSVPDSILVEGDTSAVQLAMMKSKFWTRDTITVGFLDGDADIQAKTMAAAKAWEPYCRIVFVQAPVTTSLVRVTFAQGGSWSYIGTDVSYIRYPNPTMQLGWFIQYRNNPAELSRTGTHEFGHTLGAVHEHQSPAANIPWNPTAVYAYYARMGWNKQMVDFNVLQHYDSTVVTNSTFDRQSIMLYATSASLLTDPSQAVGWNYYLSPTDKSFIGTIYPKRVGPIKRDSCIVQHKLIEKDSVFDRIVTTKVPDKIHIKRDSTYCKDTTFYR